MFENGNYIPSGKRWVAPTNINDQLNALAGRYNQNTQNTSSGNPLVDFFNSVIKPVGQAAVSTFGAPIAQLAGTIGSGGNAVEGKRNMDEFMKWNYGTNDAKDAYSKNLGAAIKTAGTVANFIPGAGAIAGNIAGGAAQGFGDEFYERGSRANLGTALGRATTGAVAEGLTAGTMKGVGNLANRAGSGLVGNLGKGVARLTNPSTIIGNVGRGALAGAVGGGTSAVGNTLASGGSLEDALNNLGGGISGGALAGGMMGGTLGLGSKGINRLRGKTIATEVVTSQPDTQYNTQTVRQRFGNALQGKQSNLTRAETRNLKLNPGEAINKVSQSTGITDLERQAEFAKRLTGSADSIMDTIQDFNLSNVKGQPIKVDTGNITSQVEQLVDKYIPHTDLSGQQRQDFILSLKRDIANGSTIQAANALKSNAAYRSRMGINASPLQRNEAALFNDIASKLDDLSYSAVPKENVARMFDDTSIEFRTRAQEAAQSGDNSTAEAYNRIAERLDASPKTIQAYRSFKKPFVDVSQINKLTQYAENGAAVNLGRGTRGAIRGAIDAVVERPINQGLAKLGAAINSNSPNAAQVPKTRISAAVPDQLTALSRQNVARSQGQNAIANTATQQNSLIDQEMADAIGGYQSQGGNINDLTIPGNISGQSANNILDALNNSMTQSAGMEQSEYGQAATMSAEPTYTLPDGRQVNLFETEQAMINAIAVGDTVAYERLAAIYDILSAAYKREEDKEASGANISDINVTQQNRIIGLQNAYDSLGSLKQLFTEAGGGQGGIGGNLAEFGATFDMNDPVSTYNSQATALINTLKDAIGKTDAANTDPEVQRLMEMIPKITDTEGEASSKLRSLSQYIQNTYDNTINTYSGNYALY